MEEEEWRRKRRRKEKTEKKEEKKEEGGEQEKTGPSPGGKGKKYMAALSLCSNTSLHLWQPA